MRLSNVGLKVGHARQCQSCRLKHGPQPYRILWGIDIISQGKFGLRLQDYLDQGELKLIEPSVPVPDMYRDLSHLLRP